MTKPSSDNKRIDVLVSQLNDIARDQIAFMNFFPSLADDIVSGLALYLGEEDCARLSNYGDEFSFVEEYGHAGLGVEGGRFRIPVMVRIRDHETCKEVDDAEEVESNVEGQGAKKVGKKKKSDKKGKTKTKKQKVVAAALSDGKIKKSKTSKKIKKKKRKKNKVAANPDCNETFLRFKLLCERKDDDIIIDIAGTKKVTVRGENLEPLYEAIFDYLKDYFSPEKFFEKEVDSYQNASYGFFRKHF